MDLEEKKKAIGVKQEAINIRREDLFKQRDELNRQLGLTTEEFLKLDGELRLIKEMQEASEEQEK